MTIRELHFGEMEEPQILQEPTWVDRNSLGLDRTGKVRALKPVFKQLMDVIRGRLNEHIDVPQGSIYNPEEEEKTKEKGEKRTVELVPLEYKDVYIAQKKENILDFLSNLSLKRRIERKVDNTSTTGEIWVSESWEEYFQKLSNDPAFVDLRDYQDIIYTDEMDGRKKKLITDEDILEAIEECLIKESTEIFKFLLSKDPFKPSISGDLSETRRAILAWALVNELFTSKITEQIDFDDMPADILIKKYGSNVEHEIFDAIMKELKPRTEISPDDSAILFG